RAAAGRRRPPRRRRRRGGGPPPSPSARGRAPGRGALAGPRGSRSARSWWSSVLLEPAHGGNVEAEAEQTGQGTEDPEADRDLLLGPANQLEVVLQWRHPEDAPSPQPEGDDLQH